MELIVLDLRISPPQWTFSPEHSLAQHSPSSLTPCPGPSITKEVGLSQVSQRRPSSLLSGYTWGHCAENLGLHLPPLSLGCYCASKFSKQLWEVLPKSEQSLWTLQYHLSLISNPSQRLFHKSLSWLVHNLPSHFSYFSWRQGAGKGGKLI